MERDELKNVDFFEQRRSVRRFSDREVSESMLDGILAAAMKAPTCGNMQLYSVVVTRDPEMLARIAPAHFSQPASTGCKVLLTVCADFNRFTRWCQISGADAGFDNFLSFTSAWADAMIYAQQVVTLAEMQGLGTCYLGTVTYNAPAISQILELPDMVVPVAAIALGWPSEAGDETERLDLRAVVHREKYRRDSDEEISALFRVKEEYEPNKGYVAENGKENLAQVFAEVRYPRGMNEDFSKSFLALLRDKKFM